MQTLPVTLAIDTAAPRLQLALLLADGSVDVLIDEIATGHAELIFGRLATLLERNGVTYDAVERVAVSTGPGSFTGLRIGLSAARGIGLARDIPVVGVPSLLAVSLSAPEGQPVAVLLDARRGEAYFQLFSSKGDPAGPAKLLPVVEAEGAVPTGAALLRGPFVDIGLLAQFGAMADPAEFPPEAAYVREADAKPQTAARIPRLS
jgi:tRNA threonylcarbamoyladenosine biosynthesis protein TsaB